MEKSSITNWLIAGLIIIVGAGAFYFVLRQSPIFTGGTGTVPVATSTLSAATSTDENPGYTVKVIPSSSKNVPVSPDMNKPFVFAASVTPQMQVTIKKGAGAKRAIITKEKYDFSAWVSLGTLYMVAGDYEQAKQIWNYVTALYPANVVTHANLGNLYDVYLKDYVLAEAEYKKAIANNPSDPGIYRNMAELYQYRYKQGTSEAADILKQGIVAVPKAVDLQVLLARYYKSAGRTADAKTTYDAAAANATAQGRTDIATSIQQESAGL